LEVLRLANVTEEPSQTKPDLADADALIKEARQRQRRRWVIVIATVLVMAGAAVAAVNGLSGSGSARSRTARQPMTPASFLARAKSGIEGTFSAVYQLSGQLGSSLSSAKTDATVTVAQRAAAGTTPSPSRGIGEWSYRLTTANGGGEEWVVRGSTLEDCSRTSASQPWRCTGPGRYKDVGYTTTYALAIIPFLPDTAYGLISYALEGIPPHHKVTIRSERSSLGPLTCLVLSHSNQICLLSDGHLASYTGEGWGGFDWTKARLVSERPTSAAADFILSGNPKEPFMLPLE
jgi:hypothetical protein